MSDIGRSTRASGPLVSIVTPSLNAGRFIEQTIESVLTQDYGPIEYTIMDGGSTDGTIEILNRYRGAVQFSIQSDNGAADAINKGFLRSRGDIFAWLNADDVYLPGAVSRAVSRFLEDPAAAVVYGESYWIDQGGAVLNRYPTRTPYNPAMLAKECCICQPSCFIRSRAFESVGMLDATLQSAFDYDLWIKLSRDFPFSPVSDFLALSRMHPGNKSLRERRLMFEENITLLRRRYGYVPVNWIYGYLSFLRDNRDQFFEPLQRSAATWLATLPVGTYYNRSRIWQYLNEWLHVTAAVHRRQSES